MPRTRQTLPKRPSREKGQRSLDSLYVNRYVPNWAQPHWQKAEFWRSIVLSLPAATVCKEYIISHISSLEWKIEPRESSQREELKDEITYYTDLFEAGGYAELSGWDYLKMIEWGLQDALDIPFGTAFETVRVPDSRNGKVVKIIPIDGSTLFPTRDNKYPIAQRLLENPTKLVLFPAHSINRYYYSPRNILRLEGWGMAPPEKIFLAINMLASGDKYYWKFVQDTPEAGILDLRDMDMESAKQWVQAFKELFTGIDSLKIPVLYEHELEAKFIPFGKDPNTIEYDKNYHRYVTLACAGYGISPTDIGFPSTGGGGGQTLAGSIRDERRTQRSGIARAKKLLQYWFNRMLPKTLKFVWIDLDSEFSVALGRSRLANATAMSQLINDRIFTQKEARLELIADGVWRTPVPEDIPEDEFIDTMDQSNERPGMLGAPINPSQGGKGEIVSRSYFDDFLLDLIDISDDKIRKLSNAIAPYTIKEFNHTVESFENAELHLWQEWHNNVLWGDLSEQIPELTLSTIDLSERAIRKITRNEDWFKFPTQEVTKSVYDLVSDGTGKELKSGIRREIRQFLSELDISKAVIAGLRNAIIKTNSILLLDNNNEIRDNVCVVSEIRSELLKLYNRLLEQFYSRVDEIIQKYSEEDLDGES